MAKVLFCIHVPADEPDLKKDKDEDCEPGDDSDKDEEQSISEEKQSTSEENTDKEKNGEGEDGDGDKDSNESSDVKDEKELSEKSVVLEIDEKTSSSAETENGSDSETAKDTKVKEQEGSQDEKDEEDDEQTNDGQSEFERMVPEEWSSLLKRVKHALEQLQVSAVHWHLTDDNIHVGMFIAGDGMRCEEILNKLRFCKIGIIPRSSVSVFPASINAAEKDDVEMFQEINEKEMELESAISEFKKSIKSRLVVDQVVSSVKSGALFTFDYFMLILLASLVAVMGLLESNSVILVASMLISPLMGPILALVFGAIMSRRDLLEIGLRSEVKGLVICILVGFLTGFIPAGLEVGRTEWRSSDSWPTIEMSSRGALRSLPVGVFIAVPSGAGVALSILGDKVGSLVGVAISASLLPPAVNAGLLWANAILAAIWPPATVGSEATMPGNSTAQQNATTTLPIAPTTNVISSLGCESLLDNSYEPQYSCNIAVENLILGLISLLLTLVNILCIIVIGYFVLKIKEVSKSPYAESDARQAAEDQFFVNDLKVVRKSYQTAKGVDSAKMKKEFLDKYQQLKSKVGCAALEEEDRQELRRIFQEVEDSTNVKVIREELRNKPQRWSSMYFTFPDSDDHIEPEKNKYNTVNLKPNNHMELKLKRRSTITPRSAAPVVVTQEEDSDKDVHFTIHRYIPVTSMLKRESIQKTSGIILPKLMIPTASRFEVAKVEDKESKDQTVQLQGASGHTLVTVTEENEPLVKTEAC